MLNKTPHKINDLNNFIGGWYIDSDEILSGLTEYYIKEELDDKVYKPNKKYKYGIAMPRPDSCEWIGPYLVELQDCLSLYIEKYPMVDNNAPFVLGKESPSIQCYYPDEELVGWHCERFGAFPICQNRVLTFTTFLSDVKDGGELEFYHHDIKIKPEKGLTLIYPADWTHSHREHLATTTKFVANGWWDYKEIK